MFKRLNLSTDQLYEVELVNPEIKPKESTVVRLFILQYAKLLNRECWNFNRISFKRFVTLTIMKNSKWTQTPSTWLCEKRFWKTFFFGRRPEKRDEWNAMSSGDCTDTFAANATEKFCPRMCFNTHKKHDKREPGLFKEEFRCTELLSLCSKTYCCYDRKSNNYKFNSKGLNKGTPEDCSDGPMSKCRTMLDESTNRSFRTIQQV